MVVKGVEKLLEYLNNTQPQCVKNVDQRIFTFDIEQSNGYVIDGIACEFDYSKPPKYYSNKQKAVVCYLWQFGIDHMYFYGRNLSELLPVWKYLAERSHTTICYVHNLLYEFAALIGYIEFTKVFARSAHKPITADYGNLQFRCSFMLSRQSLESIGENVGFPKLIEVMEYDTIRTPATKLNIDEVRYGIRDLEILTEYIGRMRQEYRTLQQIPITQTGRPRAEVRAIYKKDWKYHLQMTDLLPKNAAEYARLKAAFVGGWVHANYFYVGVNLKNAVVPWDICSSYSTQCVLRNGFPKTPFTECKNPDNFDFYLNSPRWACLVVVDFVNIRRKKTNFNDYISESKIEDKTAVGVKSENGRIYRATYFRMITTNIDLQIINDCYEVDPDKTGMIKVKRLWYSRAGYLDKRYVNYILKLYNNKVQLTNTGDPVKEELRARSKELLNSLYGLMVASLIYPDITFDNETKGWSGYEFMSEDELIKFTDTQLDELRKRQWKNFQSYAAGVWVTAFGRKQLHDAIKVINKDVVYHDTDSVYCVGDHSDFFDAYNEQMKRDLLHMAGVRGIDPELLHPRDPSGNEQWLGVYVSDTNGKPFAEFKTLGAKRYAYRIVSRETCEQMAAGVTDEKKREKILKKGDIKITIAGVNKKTGAAALHDNMDELRDNMSFDYKECGKLISHYLTDMPPITWRDRDGNLYESNQTCGVCLQPARYLMGLGDFIETLVALGSLSNQFSELEIDDLLAIGGV